MDKTSSKTWQRALLPGIIAGSLLLLAACGDQGGGATTGGGTTGGGKAATTPAAAAATKPAGTVAAATTPSAAGKAEATGTPATAAKVGTAAATTTTGVTGAATKPAGTGAAGTTGTPAAAAKVGGTGTPATAAGAAGTPGAAGVTDVGDRIDDIVGNPPDWIGRQVSVTGEVEEVVSTRAFILANGQTPTEEEILVIGAQEFQPLAGLAVGETPEPQPEIRVVGTVRRFNLTEIEQETGFNFDDNLFADWDDQDLVIVAQSVNRLQAGATPGTAPAGTPGVTGTPRP